MARRKEKQKETSQAAKERVREQLHQRPVASERWSLTNADRKALAEIGVIKPRLPPEGQLFFENEVEWLIRQYRAYQVHADKPRPSELRDHFRAIEQHLGKALFCLMGGPVPNDLVDVLPEGRWPDAESPELLYCQWDDIPDQAKILLAEAYEAEAHAATAAADDPWPRSMLAKRGITDIPAAPSERKKPETESRMDSGGKETEPVSHRGYEHAEEAVVSLVGLRHVIRRVWDNQKRISNLSSGGKPDVAKAIVVRGLLEIHKKLHQDYRQNVPPPTLHTDPTDGDPTGPALEFVRLCLLELERHLPEFTQIDEHDIRYQYLEWRAENPK